ncbi:hypothetical protein F5Y04DRAFT_274155 [Hypomontagnella monticulosa]|nr:hypothetical protein F5Y04DRAFT_274155 [Hypomontagnella monticulosa]
MDQIAFSSSNILRDASPSPCRPAKRRRIDNALDRPSSPIDIQASKGVGDGHDQPVQQQGFFTIHEEDNDVRRTEYHLPKTEHFVERLNAAYEHRWKNRRIPYTNVSALLLCWEDDDLNVREEVQDLHNVLKDTYQYQSEIWAIPSSRSCFADLTQKVNSFVTMNDDEGKLFILYYGGHAHKTGSSQPTWVSNRQVYQEDSDIW